MPEGCGFTGVRVGNRYTACLLVVTGNLLCMECVEVNGGEVYSRTPFSLSARQHTKRGPCLKRLVQTPGEMRGNSDSTSPTSGRLAVLIFEDESDIIVCVVRCREGDGDVNCE